MAARKRSATAEYLDVSGAVSEADYERVMKSLLAQFDMWRASNSWCEEFYQYVGQLTTTFRWDRANGRMELLVPVGFTDEDRGRDLREVRGRILRFTRENSDTLSLERANEFLTTAGLAPYAPVAQPQQYDVGAYAYRIMSDKTATEMRAAILNALQSEFDGVPAGKWEVTVQSRRISQQVPEGETVRLLSRSSL